MGLTSLVNYGEHMGSISKEDVIKLAKLSRLKLTEDEIAKYQVELEAILHYVDKLQDADTEGLEPTYQVTGLSNVLRNDEIMEYGVTTDDLMKNAPDHEQHMFKVKRMVG
jgi:aspartyl-tRNA(Asn)/glutamyl-tRNA(Gln) amidotransferase subunit C